jgi:hypothetical protein
MLINCLHLNSIQTHINTHTHTNEHLKDLDIRPFLIKWWTNMCSCFYAQTLDIILDVVNVPLDDNRELWKQQQAPAPQSQCLCCSIVLIGVDNLLGTWLKAARTHSSINVGWQPIVLIRSCKQLQIIYQFICTFKFISESFQSRLKRESPWCVAINI